MGPNHNGRSADAAGSVWLEVEEALEAIIDRYESVNHAISLFQDEKARRRGLEAIGSLDGTGLELGSGPGNFTLAMLRNLDGFLIGLDYSERMLSVARSRVKGDNLSFVRGVFEYLPVRSMALSFVTAAYALRDSTHKERVIANVSRTLRSGGKFLVVDIGKPDNPLARGFFHVYMRFMVPIIAGLAGGYGYRNPWMTLFETYRLLPVNKDLLRMLARSLGSARMEELVLGALTIFLAEKGAIKSSFK